MLCALLQATAASAAESAAALVDRGRYLTLAADCAGCHTDPKDGRPFAGGRPVQTPFGVVLAANITPDLETGIGAWTDAQFEAAVRGGHRPDGRRLYPAMPFPYYTRMSSEEVSAIRGYLGTVLAVDNAVASNQLPFPFRIRATLRIWDALYFDPKPYVPDPASSAAWNRGAYLVQGPGHCGACHTPKSFLGGDKSRRFLQGYSLQGWFAPDLTSNDPGGLGRWAAADIVDYLRSGHNRYGAASGMMAEEVELASSHMTDEDLTAIATYLKNLPGHTQAHPSVRADDPRMVCGKAIYADLCSACHAPDGRGVAYLFPNLAESSSVASRESTSLVHVVLHGADSAATDKEPTGPAMPSFGWQLTDEQIAAVATYVRNSWGHTGSVVRPSDVAKARRVSGGDP